MSTVFVSPNWRMPRNANQSKSANYSLNFDGNDAIEIPQTTATDITGSNTIAMWVNRSTSGSNQNLVNKRGTSGTQYAFFIETTNLLGFDDGTGAKAYGNTVIPTDVWTHVAVVVESSGCTFYINGVSDGGVSSGISVGANTHTTYIGKKYSNTFYLNGKLSQVCFFDYALSASQVTTLWGGGTSASNPMALPNPPKAYYPLGTSAWNGNFLAENNAIGDYVFDNIFSSRIFTPISVSNLTNVTQSVWFKTSTNAQLNKYIFFVGQYGTFVLQLNGTDTLRAGVTVNPLTQTYPSLTFNYADGKWHQYIMNYDGSHIKLYVDGILRIKTARTGTLRDEPTYFTTIGNVGGTSSNAGATGEYSSFVAYEHTLTDGGISVGDAATGEIATLYNYGSPIRTLANIPQNSNLKAWYKLDASEIYNSSSTEWEVNQASSFWKNSVDFNLTFSSSNKAYVQCANTTNLNLTGAMTLSAWMKGDQLGGGNYNGLGTQGGGASRGYGLLRGPNNAVFSISDNGSSHRYVSSPASTWLDGWNHVVGVFDPNSRFEVYVNGVFSASGTNYAQQTSTNPFQIGNRGDGSHYYNWLGQLSNVSIWNTALSNGGASVGSVAGGEIATLYNGGDPLQNLLTGPQNSNLLSWWKLDNITTGIQDSKGTNNGTIVTLGDGSVTSFNQSVSTLNGESQGMSQSNLVQSDLQTVAPYSKYAMNFDAGNADYIDLTSQIVLTSELAISCWVKSDGAVVYGIVAGDNGSADSWYRFYPAAPGGNRVDIMIDGTSTEWNFANGGTPIQNGVWQHYLLKRDSSNKWTFYLDNVKYTTNQPTISGSFRVDTFCRIYSGSPRYFEGAMSNMAIWNTSLSDSQVREVYNQGLPGNLNSFSGTAPIHWWQLGEGSYYEGGWIFADEIGSINGEGQNIAETDLTNGVGTTANGMSTGMGVEALVSDAPYSTGNAMSVNMAATAKGTNVP